MESVINAYSSRELVSKDDRFPLQKVTPLLETGMLDSLSVLKLVLFLAAKFDVVVNPTDLIAKYFQTVDAICAYLRVQQQVQGVQG